MRFVRTPDVNRLMVCLAAATLLACGDLHELDTEAEAEAPIAGVAAQSQELAWGANDDPGLLSANLRYDIDELPERGESRKVPWAGSYWPTYLDGINDKWAGPGTQSAPAKYGTAFGVTGVEDGVSGEHALDAAPAPVCTTGSQCNSGTCYKRPGKTAGKCVDTWWGICHAWAVSAILFDEPQRPVTRNGVTFKVNDLKALVSQIGVKTNSRLISGRCYEDEQQGDIKYDAYGRPIAHPNCIDTNPATFHILLANLVGIRSETFIEDRTYDDEVWNHPIRGFRVLDLDEITAAQANALVGVQAQPFLEQGLAEVVATGGVREYGPLDVSPGTTFKARISAHHASPPASEDPDLYVRFGAAASVAQFNCRSVTFGYDDACTIQVPAGESQVYVAVTGYSGTSTFDVVMEGEAAPSTYAFNPQAKRFQKVRMEVDYMIESDSGLDGNLGDQLDNYTSTDTYDYVLEAHADGRLIGGEWLGASKTNHPDFVWLPWLPLTGSTIGNGKIAIEHVLELHAESVAGTNKVHRGGVLPQGEWRHYGPFRPRAGTKLVAKLSGGANGDADLYVRRGQAPTLGDFNCRPYLSSSAEQCEMLAGGELYVAVRAYLAETFDLEVQFAQHVNTTGQLTQGDWFTAALEVEQGQQVVLRTKAANDVDLYVRMGAAPTTADFTDRAWSPEGDEQLLFTAPNDGTLHLGVHGYQASDFQVFTGDH